MFENRNEFSISRMAKVLKASESGYYKWLSRLSAPPSRKELEDSALAHEIMDIFRRSRGSYGSRKVTRLVNRSRQIPVNHKRVERIMSEYCLFSRTCRRYRCTTDSNHKEAIADNLLGRNFRAGRANEKMVSDTTVVATREGDVYAAGIIDLFGRMPVGLAMSSTNDSTLVLSALKDMTARGYGEPGCIMHSDRGATYSSKIYRVLLSDHGFLCSMSRKGDCWDNAPMESFWGKMKTEWLKPRYDTIAEAERDIYEYVWHFYPRERPHAANGYLTPLEYYEQG
jgi:putative transposase